jgi:hypothetical protein
MIWTRQIQDSDPCLRHQFENLDEWGQNEIERAGRKALPIEIFEAHNFLCDYLTIQREI